MFEQLAVFCLDVVCRGTLVNEYVDLSYEGRYYPNNEK